ncbi:MAG TPA: V-type ATP synthase subunit D [Parachlamydiaceae bacterium]|nr:V-type ATP synthase subunit D [Parachlamydiaceae bacterium]
MAEIKLTKNELRMQQAKLSQLEKYLPTLQLKKAMLQIEVNEARLEISHLEEAYQKFYEGVKYYASLLSEKMSLDLTNAAKILDVKKRYENIAGVEVPYFESISFEDFQYDLMDTPAWIDPVVIGLRELATAAAKVTVAREKKVALDKELLEVSIRVNLFEKILIPRGLRNIKKIKVFLGDQQLAAVSQAKVAKSKIEAHKQKLKFQREAKKCASM